MQHARRWQTNEQTERERYGIYGNILVVPGTVFCRNVGDESSPDKLLYPNLITFFRDLSSSSNATQTHTFRDSDRHACAQCWTHSRISTESVKYLKWALFQNSTALGR